MQSHKLLLEDESVSREEMLAIKPVWRRPRVAVLLVERGTAASSGAHADGVDGSTSSS